jgi:hypothetical protein
MFLVYFVLAVYLAIQYIGVTFMFYRVARGVSFIELRHCLRSCH